MFPRQFSKSPRCSSPTVLSFRCITYFLPAFKGSMCALCGIHRWCPVSVTNSRVPRVERISWENFMLRQRSSVLLTLLSVWIDLCRQSMCDPISPKWCIVKCSRHFVLLRSRIIFAIVAIVWARMEINPRPPFAFNLKIVLKSHANSFSYFIHHLIYSL